MGWSTSCILVNEREAGYLGTFPNHDPAAARELVRRLALGPIRHSSLSNFDAGLGPKAGWFCIGAYPGAALLAGVPALIGCVEHEENQILAKLLQEFPRASLLALELASATNYFAYAYFSKGLLLRALAGDAERGVVVNTGTPQPEEAPVLATISSADFRHKGESLGFAMSQQFFGCPLDRFAAEKLTVELIKVSKPVWPFSVFQKSN
jgi:hypothetical protein